MDRLHPDFASLSPLAEAIERRAGGAFALRAQMPVLIQDAIDFVVDPVRTGRTRLIDLDNVEKTFIGLKVEHFFRDFIDVPKGLRDLNIEGIDVDVKNTVGNAWTIPPETYRNSEPVLLFLIADALGYCSVGLMIARIEYLRPSLNRDAKRSTSAAARQNILWLVEKEKLPDSRWAGMDMERFRELRLMAGGSKRAAQFFAENLDRPIHRSVIQALLHDQHDYMKRLRRNGGARDILAKQHIALFSGLYHQAGIVEAKLPATGPEELIAHRFYEPTWLALKSIIP